MGKRAMITSHAELGPGTYSLKTLSVRNSFGDSFNKTDRLRVSAVLIP